MRYSLRIRLFRTVFAVSLVTALLSIAAIEVFYEDMEDSILDLELTKEQGYFRQHISRDDFQEWQTARLHAIFLGQGQPEERLPAYLRNLPTPYSAEIEGDNATYLVRTESMDGPAGRLYLSQDISIMESQELLSQLTVLSVLAGMALIGFIMSRLLARRLTRPLQQLTNQIQATAPASSMRRLSTDYRETEFVDIAAAFNRFLDALETFVEREKSFVKLASHELRTPLAVITGALDIIEKRDTLSEADARTIKRIRRAAMDMQADVNVLLRLARGNMDEEQRARLGLRQAVEDTITDLESTPGSTPGRLRLQPGEVDLTLLADPALLRMLIRNLLQNALKHTRGSVDIDVTSDGMQIVDYGAGLPDRILERLSRSVQGQAGMQESSFGLLIVQLICERLGWTLDVAESGADGTAMFVSFGTSLLGRVPAASRRSGRS
ncbi:HAMP domain-containing histidine kinase [Marinobacter halodurans]|uniref:histidine kinase n=1 Tax=Marinobacter halodurans TaxID=2528979 RepID=A0ABY1ZPA4_9GAMM|nr:HAMP domain-containing sensor histidine kinase [Marinobacter halodurans]TBW58575.1 HAMP domain-containing histidine kinase [Marinobacter halodurans]